VSGTTHEKINQSQHVSRSRRSEYRIRAPHKFIIESHAVLTPVKVHAWRIMWHKSSLYSPYQEVTIAEQM
jgi:hypothetical protein